MSAEKIAGLFIIIIAVIFVVLTTADVSSALTEQENNVNNSPIAQQLYGHMKTFYSFIPIILMVIGIALFRM